LISNDNSGTAALSLDEILHTHLSRQLLEPYWISRSSVQRSRSHRILDVCVCMMLRLPADST